MQWEFIIALVLGIPIVLFPVALIWYLNIGGLYTAIRKFFRRRAERKRWEAGVEKAGKRGESAGAA